jgi:hypothetical protein
MAYATDTLVIQLRRTIANLRGIRKYIPGAFRIFNVVFEVNFKRCCLKHFSRTFPMPGQQGEAFYQPSALIL